MVYLTDINQRSCCLDQSYIKFPYPGKLRWGALVGWRTPVVHKGKLTKNLRPNSACDLVPEIFWRLKWEIL
jgi:hypothetical protein